MEFQGEDFLGVGHCWDNELQFPYDFDLLVDHLAEDVNAADSPSLSRHNTKTTAVITHNGQDSSVYEAAFHPTGIEDSGCLFDGGPSAMEAVKGKSYDFTPQHQTFADFGLDSHNNSAVTEQSNTLMSAESSDYSVNLAKDCSTASHASNSNSAFYSYPTMTTSANQSMTSLDLSVPYTTGSGHNCLPRLSPYSFPALRSDARINMSSLQPMTSPVNSASSANTSVLQPYKTDTGHQTNMTGPRRTLPLHKESQMSVQPQNPPGVHLNTPMPAPPPRDNPSLHIAIKSSVPSTIAEYNKWHATLPPKAQKLLPSLFTPNYSHNYANDLGVNLYMPLVETELRGRKRDRSLVGEAEKVMSLDYRDECWLTGGVTMGGGETPYLTFNDFKGTSAMLDGFRSDPVHCTPDKQTIFRNAAEMKQWRDVRQRGNGATADNYLPRNDQEKQMIIKQMFKAFKTLVEAEGNCDILKPYMNQFHDNHSVEALCWDLLEYAIAISTGSESLPTMFGTYKPKSDQTFSERIDDIISFMRQEKSGCNHLIRPPYAAVVADNPGHAQARAEANRGLNAKKGIMLAEGQKKLVEEQEAEGTPQTREKKRGRRTRVKQTPENVVQSWKKYVGGAMQNEEDIEDYPTDEETPPSKRTVPARPSAIPITLGTRASRTSARPQGKTTPLTTPLTTAVFGSPITQIQPQSSIFSQSPETSDVPGIRDFNLSSGGHRVQAVNQSQFGQVHEVQPSSAVHDGEECVAVGEQFDSPNMRPGLNANMHLNTGSNCYSTSYPRFLNGPRRSNSATQPDIGISSATAGFALNTQIPQPRMSNMRSGAPSSNECQRSLKLFGIPTPSSSGSGDSQQSYPPSQ